VLKIITAKSFPDCYIYRIPPLKKEGSIMIGTLNKKQLEAVLETLPIEFSVVDENDKVLAWNRHGTRLFKRPEAVVGRDVQDCHPKKSVDRVEKILREMKTGIRETAEFWIDLEIEGVGQKILIQYFALRDEEGVYLGCLEASQNIGHIQSLTGQKRLLD
jgi:PAS domain S-box-containing protein